MIARQGVLLCGSKMFGVNVTKGMKPSKPAGPAVVAVRRPELRGLLMRQLKLKLVGGAVLVFSAAVCWRVAVCHARKNAYINFYNNYDTRADFERMRRVGVFHCLNPDGTIRQP